MSASPKRGSKSVLEKQKRSEYWSLIGKRSSILSEYFVSLLQERDVIIVFHKEDESSGAKDCYSAINTKRGAMVIK